VARLSADVRKADAIAGADRPAGKIYQSPLGRQKTVVKKIFPRGLCILQSCDTA
jgi:hypothetical protein